VFGLKNHDYEGTPGGLRHKSKGLLNPQRKAALAPCISSHVADGLADGHHCYITVDSILSIPEPIFFSYGFAIVL